MNGHARGPQVQCRFTAVCRDAYWGGAFAGATRAVRRLIVSHIRTDPETQRQMLAGDLEVEYLSLKAHWPNAFALAVWDWVL
jgi:hypothetical protein